MRPNPTSICAPRWYNLWFEGCHRPVSSSAFDPRGSERQGLHQPNSQRHQRPSASTASDKINDFKTVALLQRNTSPFGFGDDGMVQFNPDPAPAEVELLNQSDQACVAVDRIRFAVEFNREALVRIASHHFQSNTGGAARAQAGNFKRRVWLPYAGITRIRFKGSSCEFSVRLARPQPVREYIPPALRQCQKCNAFHKEDNLIVNLNQDIDWSAFARRLPSSDDDSAK
jgi:hypothetical protein